MVSMMARSVFPGTVATLSWRLLAVALTVVLLGGCVTTQSGGLPAPAPKEKRLQAQLDLARANLRERNYERARDPLERALKIDPESVEAHVLFAVLSNGEGEPEIAERYFRKAVKLGPEDSQALSNFGSYLIAAGRPEEALPLLKRAVKDPGYVQRGQAYENLGIASLLTGDTDGAQRAFVRAVSLNPDQARSSLELAEMAYGRGDYVDAQDLYLGFRRNARQTPRSLCLGMQIASQLKDRDSVASYALALKNLFPNSSQAKTCRVAE